MCEQRLVASGRWQICDLKGARLQVLSSGPDTCLGLFFLRDKSPPRACLSHRIPHDLGQVVLTLQALFSADKSWLLLQL